MAFTAKIWSWHFCHLNIVGCLLKRRFTKGGVMGTPGPPLAAPLSSTVWLLTVVCVVWCKTFAASFALFHYVPSLTYS